MVSSSVIIILDELLVKWEFMRQPRLFLAIILSVDIDDHRLLLKQFDQIVITMFQLELQLFRV